MMRFEPLILQTARPAHLRRTRPAVGPITAARFADEVRRKTPHGRGVSNRKGVKFERDFGAALRSMADCWAARQPGLEVWSGRWIEFQDDRGFLDLAQPDHFAILADRTLLFECKLTQTNEAHHQLRSIYAPLLEHILQRPAVKIAVWNSLVAQMDRPLDSIEALLFEPLTAPESAVFEWFVPRPERLSR
jgi:hypothetical protein